MAYTPTTWQTGDVITAEKMNKLENGVAAVPVEAGTGQKSAVIPSYDQTLPNTASGNGAFAFGTGATASGSVSVAMGNGVTASNTPAIAIGGTVQGDTGTKATAAGSIAIGNSCEATGAYAVAIGYKADATGTGSLSVGAETVSSGQFSLATGYKNTASANYAFTSGRNGEAKAVASATFGYRCIANGASSVVIGQSNIEDTSAEDSSHGSGSRDLLFIIGNGSRDGTTRSNALTVDWSGNEALAGSLTLGKGTANEVTITAQQLTALLALLNG